MRDTRHLDQPPHGGRQGSAAELLACAQQGCPVLGKGLFVSGEHHNLHLEDKPILTFFWKSGAIYVLRVSQFTFGGINQY